MNHFSHRHKLDPTHSTYLIRKYVTLKTGSPVIIVISLFQNGGQEPKEQIPEIFSKTKCRLLSLHCRITWSTLGHIAS